MLASAALPMGCGSDPLPVATTELPAASRVGPRAYLADAALAADAGRAFVAVLGTVGPELTPAEARRIAPDLRTASDRLALASQRLSAGRVEDTRLEGQRTRVTPPLSEVARLADQITTLAEQGKATELVALLPDLRTALAALRAAAS